MPGAAVAGAGTHAAGTWCEDTGCTTPLLRGAGMVSTWTRGQEQADKCALTTPANDQCCYMQHACVCAQQTYPACYLVRSKHLGSLHKHHM
jgi:hypothetical protein